MEKIKDGFKGEKAIIIPPKIKENMAKDPITADLYITDIGYYPTAKGHYRERLNGTKEHILIYCKSGEGWAQMNGEKFIIKKNQFIIISASTPHSYGADIHDPWSIYWIHFDSSKDGLFDQLFNHTSTVTDDVTARFDDRLQLFEEMYRNLEMGYSIDNLQYCSLCLGYLLASLRFIPQYREINRVKDTDIIQQSISYMKENISERITLEMIAENVSYSPSHFSIIFTKKTGDTPLNYFNQMKIQTACQYLDFTDMKVKEIAFKLGFYDQYYFSKVFTKYMRTSPSEYREREKG